jgi:hypothetical protein
MEELENDLIQLQRLRHQLPSLNGSPCPSYSSHQSSRYGIHSQTRERMRQVMAGGDTPTTSASNGIGSEGRRSALPNSVVNISDATLRVSTRSVQRA